MKVKIGFLKADVWLQSTIIAFNTLLWVLGIWQAGFWIGILLLQIVIGIYQVAISGLLHLQKAPLIGGLGKLRRVHFWGSFIYVGLFFIFIDSINDWGRIVFGLILPQLIAYGYFGLTWLDYHSRKSYLDKRPTIFSY